MAKILNYYWSANDTSLLYAFEMRLSRLQYWVDALDYNSEKVKEKFILHDMHEWTNYKYDILKGFEILKINRNEKIRNIEYNTEFQIPEYVDNDLMTTYGRTFAKPFRFLFGDEILLHENTRIKFNGLLLKIRAMSIHVQFLRKYLIVKDELKDKLESIMKLIQQSIEMFNLIVITAIYKEVAYKHIMVPNLRPRDKPGLIGPKRNYPSNDELLFGDKIILDTAMINIKEYMNTVDHIREEEYLDLFTTEFHNMSYDPSFEVFERLLGCINDTLKKCKYFLRT